MTWWQKYLGQKHSWQKDVWQKNGWQKNWWQKNGVGNDVCGKGGAAGDAVRRGQEWRCFFEGGSGKQNGKRRLVSMARNALPV